MKTDDPGPPPEPTGEGPDQPLPSAQVPAQQHEPTAPAVEPPPPQIEPARPGWQHPEPVKPEQLGEGPPAAEDRRIYYLYALLQSWGTTLRFIAVVIALTAALIGLETAAMYVASKSIHSTATLLTGLLSPVGIAAGTHLMRRRSPKKPRNHRRRQQ